MKTLAVCAVLTIIVSAAHAQTGAEKAACHHDAVKFCSYALSGSGPFTVAACLASHRAKLSKGCSSVFAARGM